MCEKNGFKSNRVLELYTKLLNGDVINKADEAERYGVNQRTLQRDIDDLRAFFDDQRVAGNSSKEVVYSRAQGGYYLKSKNDASLNNDEILAVCKILLESRAFCREEITPIINKLLDSCVPKRNRDLVKGLISNELFHYVEPHHRRKFLGNLWELGMAVKEHKFISIKYIKQGGDVVERIIKPVGIMFSEYYFYLTAFIEGADKTRYRNPDDIYPTIYRIDRIMDFAVLNKHFDIPYKDRFEEGEFRKRVQFMYGGSLRKIRFIYTGANVESVLDRLPTAEIVGQQDGCCIIKAEVFGDGIDMWIRSQGDNIKMLT